MNDTPGSAVETWLARGSAVTVVVGYAAVWVLVSALSPDTMRMLHIYPGQRRSEGPFEVLELIVLAGCFVAWMHITQRVVGNRRAWVLAGLMLLQVGVLFGEELDWGEAVGMRTVGDRNLRMLLRDHGILQKWNDAFGLVIYLLWFLVVPLVPVDRVRSWLDRAAPVRAYPGDGVALAVILPLWLLGGWLLGAPQSVEFVQMAGYLIFSVVTARVWWAAWGNAAPGAEHDRRS